MIMAVEDLLELIEKGYYIKEIAVLLELNYDNPYKDVTSLRGNLSRHSTQWRIPDTEKGRKLSKILEEMNDIYGSKTVKGIAQLPERSKEKRQTVIDIRSLGKKKYQELKDIGEFKRSRRFRRFYVYYKCKNENYKGSSKIIDPHIFYFVYKGKANTVRGIKQSAMLNHDKAFTDHERLEFIRIEELT